MPLTYVKQYVKRGKTVAADADAVCDAVTRPSMPFVPVMTEAQQLILITHRVRGFLVRQLTQATNAIRADLGECLLVKGEFSNLPVCARNPIHLLAEQFWDTKEKVEDVSGEIRAGAQSDETARRL